MKLLALCSVLASSFLVGAAEADLPAATNLIARILDRAQLVARETLTNHYVYDNRTNQLIGTADDEDKPIHRVKPRSLRVRGQS